MSEPFLICLVDDDASVRTAIESLIRSYGQEVRCFASAEAFLAAPELRPDCLICDVQMPGLSGLELFEILQRRGKRIPIIFITAFQQDRLREVVGKDVLVLAKPFDGATLMQALTSILDHSG